MGATDDIGCPRVQATRMTRAAHVHMMFNGDAGLDRRGAGAFARAARAARYPLFALDRIGVPPGERLTRVEVHRTARSRIASDHYPLFARFASSARGRLEAIASWMPRETFVTSTLQKTP
jgi:hypothetical protein